jgi:diaminopimelate epimerase
MQLHFNKYQGTGNDFIILDNRTQEYKDLTKLQIQKICARHMGIGADGLMLLNKSETCDFEMQYYNSDGNESSMCGNGGRCITLYAKHLGMIDKSANFKAIDGMHECTIDDEDSIELKMCDVHSIHELDSNFIVQTGSPHFVTYVNDVNAVDVRKEGAAIRYHSAHDKDGINVNFVQNIAIKTLRVRTYERGVEDETMSCGTGVTAAALVHCRKDIGLNYVRISTPGGTLMVKCKNHDGNRFTEILLCGPARFVFKGSIEI